MNWFISTLVALFGLAILLYRLKPWRHEASRSLPHASEPRVSIIIPCRNESANLPQLLTSLEKLRYRNFEIIVVDDHSTDDTFEIATRARSRFTDLRVVSAPERPSNWGGKNWACFAAVPYATGNYLLFTDADTFHTPESLHLAVGFSHESGHGLISAPPFHRCEKRWEKFTGSFQLLPLLAGAYLQKPTSHRLFAIGQYLLFTRDSYLELGGHSAVSDSLAEDFDLAQLWIRKGKGYGVFPHAEIFEVQMYDSFLSFFEGWRRLLRLGMKRSQIRACIEIACSLNVLGFCFFSPSLSLLLIALAGFIIVARAQRPLGRFSMIGAALTPLGAWLFCLVSLFALFDTLRNAKLKWRGREYTI